MSLNRRQSIVGPVLRLCLENWQWVPEDEKVRGTVKNLGQEICQNGSCSLTATKVFLDRLSPLRERFNRVRPERRYEEKEQGRFGQDPLDGRLQMGLYCGSETM